MRLCDAEKQMQALAYVLVRAYNTGMDGLRLHIEADGTVTPRIYREERAN